MIKQQSCNGIYSTSVNEFKRECQAPSDVYERCPYFILTHEGDKCAFALRGARISIADQVQTPAGFKDFIQTIRELEGEI
jgi:hypothetical protein